MDAPDPQGVKSGRERQRLVRFSIFWSQKIAFSYVPLLDYAGVKNLNVCSLGAPLLLTVGSHCSNAFYLTFSRSRSLAQHGPQRAPAPAPDLRGQPAVVDPHLRTERLPAHPDLQPRSGCRRGINHLQLEGQAGLFCRQNCIPCTLSVYPSVWGSEDPFRNYGTN